MMQTIRTCGLAGVIAAVAIAVGAVSALAQPGTIPMTPHVDVPLKSQQVEIPAKFQGMIDANPTVNLPDGWRARIFYMGRLDGARFLTWGPDSVLYVANVISGEVLALPDKNPKDGVADTAIIAATNAFGHDLKFYNGAMYVAEVGRVLRLTDGNSDGVYENRSVFIDGLATGGNHVTRTIVFDSARGKVYISVGSSCNVCRENDRAHIEEYNIDGTGRRVYASGVRNAVGMTLHPRTGKLWATNNGSDDLGDDIPPEWIDIVREGGFYGWPFAHSYQVYNDFTAHGGYQGLLPITSADSALVRMMVPPAALVQAHSALMAIEFPNSNAFPAAYRRGAFVVSRGSWNRSVPTGFKVIYLDFENDQDTIANTVGDFLTGFLTDSINARWARPVGLESDMMGNLYLTSNDQTQFVMMISPETASGVQESAAPGGALTLLGAHPNPAGSSATLRFVLPAAGRVSVDLLDLLGRPVLNVVDARSFEAGERSVDLDLRNIPAGTYFYRVSGGGEAQVGRLQVVR